MAKKTNIIKSSYRVELTGDEIESILTKYVEEKFGVVVKNVDVDVNQGFIRGATFLSIENSADETFDYDLKKK
jgi:phosphoribosyl-ATP pyrophosphohydrolase